MCRRPSSTTARSGCAPRSSVGWRRTARRAAGMRVVVRRRPGRRTVRGAARPRTAVGASPSCRAASRPPRSAAATGIGRGGRPPRELCAAALRPDPRPRRGARPADQRADPDRPSGGRRRPADGPKTIEIRSAPVGGPSLPPTGIPLPVRKRRTGPGVPLQGSGTAAGAWSRPGTSIVPDQPVQRLGAPPGVPGGADSLPSWGVPASPPYGFAAAARPRRSRRGRTPVRRRGDETCRRRRRCRRRARRAGRRRRGPPRGAGCRHRRRGGAGRHRG